MNITALQQRIVEAVPSIKNSDHELSSALCFLAQLIDLRTNNGNQQESDAEFMGSLLSVERPIRISDVLKSMQGNLKAPIGVDMNGYFLDCDDDMKQIQILEVRWNLLEDDLTKQSPECLQFLSDLLC